MTGIKALVLTGYGLNCDMETAHALTLAGAIPHRVHINRLVSGEVRRSDFHILVFGGGFSWGDDHGAGVNRRIERSPAACGKVHGRPNKLDNRHALSYCRRLRKFIESHRRGQPTRRCNP